MLAMKTKLNEVEKKIDSFAKFFSYKTVKYAFL